VRKKLRSLPTSINHKLYPSHDLKSHDPKPHSMSSLFDDHPPPHRIISSKPVTAADASSILDRYLKNSTKHPHLHPDAQITQNGVVQFSSFGGPQGGVVLHNLRRVAAGLHGEFLEPEGTPEPEDGAGEGTGGIQFGGSKKDKRNKSGDSSTSQGWQDRAEYEREEGVMEIGEVGDRSNFVQEGGEMPEVQVTSGEPEKSDKKDKKKKSNAVEENAVMETTEKKEKSDTTGEVGDKTSKEERKLMKKQRSQQRKRDLAKQTSSTAPATH
jgi:hypothetical protein